jgi:hypothetical protein
MSTLRSLVSLAAAFLALAWSLVRLFVSPPRVALTDGAGRSLGECRMPRREVLDFAREVWSVVTITVVRT